MDQNISNNIDFKNRINNFFVHHKIKILIFLICLIAIIFSMFILKHNNEKNIIYSEKFIKAGLHLASNNKSDAKALYEEIILSRISFTQFYH